MKYIKEWLFRTGGLEMSPLKKSASLALGVFLGIVPIWGWQTVSAVFLAHIFKISRGYAIIGTWVSFPPLMPLVIWGSLKLGTYLNFYETNNISLHDNILGCSLSVVFKLGAQYILGAIFLGIFAGLLSFTLTYPFFKLLQQNKKK